MLFLIGHNRFVKTSINPFEFSILAFVLAKQDLSVATLYTEIKHLTKHGRSQAVDEINNEKFDKHYRELSVELFALMKSLLKESKRHIEKHQNILSIKKPLIA